MSLFKTCGEWKYFFWKKNIHWIFLVALINLKYCYFFYQSTGKEVVGCKIYFWDHRIELFFLEFSSTQTIDQIFKQHLILLYRKKTWKKHWVVLKYSLFKKSRWLFLESKYKLFYCLLVKKLKKLFTCIFFVTIFLLGLHLGLC